MIEINDMQKIWLNQRGGRDIRDVLEDEEGKLFVFMQEGRKGQGRVYLPEAPENKYAKKN